MKMRSSWEPGALDSGSRTASTRLQSDWSRPFEVRPSCGSRQRTPGKINWKRPQWSVESDSASVTLHHKSRWKREEGRCPIQSLSDLHPALGLDSFGAKLKGSFPEDLNWS